MFPMPRLRPHSTYCPNVCGFKCKEYGHIVVDCPHWIPLSETPAHQHRQDSSTGHCTRSTFRHHHQDGYRHSRSSSQSHPHRYKVTAITTPTDAIPGHITETVDATIGTLCDAVTPVLIIFTVTHYINDHPHTGVLQLIQKITGDPDHTLHINQVRKLCISLHPILADLQQNLKIEDIPQSQ